MTCYTEEELLLIQSCDMWNSYMPTVCSYEASSVRLFQPKSQQQQHVVDTMMAVANDYYLCNESEVNVGSPKAVGPIKDYQIEPSGFPSNVSKRKLSQALDFEDDEEYKPDQQSRKLKKMKRNNSSSTPAGGSNNGARKTSRFRGVCWYARTQRWVVQIKTKGCRKHIGYFKCELEAHKAYQEAMRKIQNGESL